MQLRGVRDSIIDLNHEVVKQRNRGKTDQKVLDKRQARIDKMKERYLKTQNSHF